jgi:hypothetical protein
MFFVMKKLLALSFLQFSAVTMSPCPKPRSQQTTNKKENEARGLVFTPSGAH